MNEAQGATSRRRVPHTAREPNVHRFRDDEWHLDFEDTVTPNRQMSEEEDGHVGDQVKALAKKSADSADA